MASDLSSRRVELFVRSLSPAPTRSPVDDHLRRLRDLSGDEDGVDLSVDVWGREVGLSTIAIRTDAGEYVLDRVAAFREWADEAGVSVEPFFETRTVGSGIAGEPYTALVLPVCCLAEYEGDSLVHVAPYATDSAVHSVADRVRALERAAGDAADSPGTAAGSDPVAWPGTDPDSQPGPARTIDDASSVSPPHGEVHSDPADDGRPLPNR